MFKTSQMMPLFAVPVWAQQLEEETAATMNAHLLEQIDALKADPPGAIPSGQSWQSRTDLQTLEAFQGIKEIILAAGERVLEALRVEPAPFEITASWMNVQSTGAGHSLRGQPNNYLCGIYCVKAAEGADTFSLRDCRMDQQTIVPRFSEASPLNSPIARVPAKAGVLYMFPAWLPLAFDPNPTAALRVSLSFNIMFSDFTATMARPH